MSRSALMLPHRTLEYGSCSRHASRMASDTCGRMEACKRHVPDLSCANADAGVNKASPASCAAPVANCYLCVLFWRASAASLHQAAARAAAACLAAQIWFHAAQAVPGHRSCRGVLR